jgi:hypothetical protein
VAAAPQDAAVGAGAEPQDAAAEALAVQPAVVGAERLAAVAAEAQPAGEAPQAVARARVAPQPAVELRADVYRNIRRTCSPQETTCDTLDTLLGPRLGLPGFVMLARAALRGPAVLPSVAVFRNAHK